MHVKDQAKSSYSLKSLHLRITLSKSPNVTNYLMSKLSPSYLEREKVEKTIPSRSFLWKHVGCRLDSDKFPLLNFRFSSWGHRNIQSWIVLHTSA